MIKEYKVILFSVIAMMCILNNVFAETRKEPWTDSSHWEKLQKGMAEKALYKHKLTGDLLHQNGFYFQITQRHLFD